MDCSTPGFPVLHYLPELVQIQTRWVSDAIQPSHSLSSPSPPAFNIPLAADTSWGLRLRCLSVSRESKNQPWFLDPSLNQPWCSEGAIHRAQLQQGRVTQVGSNLLCAVLMSPVDNLQKSDALIQCPEAVLILEHHVLPADPSPLSPFVPITILQGRFYNFPGADAEKES